MKKTIEEVKEATDERIRKVNKELREEKALDRIERVAMYGISAFIMIAGVAIVKDILTNQGEKYEYEDEDETVVEPETEEINNKLSMDEVYDIYGALDKVTDTEFTDKGYDVRVKDYWYDKDNEDITIVMMAERNKG